MRMIIEGEYNELSRVGRRFLDSVSIESRVYSKKQARAEFERFLSSVDLPDMTPEEEHAERQQVAIDAGISVKTVEAADRIFASAEEERRKDGEE